MDTKDLDLMIDVLALNLIANEVEYESLGISQNRMAELINKFKTNKVVVANSQEGSMNISFATLVVNRILERNGIN